MRSIEEKALPVSVLDELSASTSDTAFKRLKEKLSGFNRKIVVLDDDPTGVQTVHGISVYTNWRSETLKEAFAEDNSMFFILTNSRGLTSPQTAEIHKELARNIYAASKEAGKQFVLISRSDSTLRGHYPLETQILREELEKLGHPAFDGEIIYPFFMEGGRFTIGDIHYVREGDLLTPAGQTEFATDKTFGYKSSYLPNWCEEKTGGAYKAEDVTCVSLDELRAENIDKITGQLLAVTGFGKVIVNSADYADVAVFMTSLLDAFVNGKEFMFRSAAAVTKVLGGVPDRGLLSRDELIAPGNVNGGIVLVGSHVNKTTQQLEALKNSDLPLEYLEFNVKMALEEGGLEKEVAHVTQRVQECITAGQSVVVYTSRTLLELDTKDKDAQLALSVRISDAVTSIISNLTVRPGFIIAKGGITSSDVGVKALSVRRATVMGQVKPGIPVWMTGTESKFAGMPYIIFPGNVGGAETLRDITAELLS